MNNEIKRRDFAVVIAVAVVWTVVVIGFSTSMGARPLRIYDWGPPIFACLLTLLCMMKEIHSGRHDAGGSRTAGR